MPQKEGCESENVENKGQKRTNPTSTGNHDFGEEDMFKCQYHQFYSHTAIKMHLASHS